MGPGQNFLNLFGLGHFFVARFGSHPPLGLEIFPLKIPNFSIFSIRVVKISHRVRSKNTWVKDGWTSYLLRVKKVCSAQVCSGPISISRCTPFSSTIEERVQWSIMHGNLAMKKVWMVKCKSIKILFGLSTSRDGPWPDSTQPELTFDLQ